LGIEGRIREGKRKGGVVGAQGRGSVTRTLGEGVGDLIDVGSTLDEGLCDVPVAQLCRHGERRDPVVPGLVERAM